MACVQDDENLNQFTNKSRRAKGKYIIIDYRKRYKFYTSCVSRPKLERQSTAQSLDRVVALGAVEESVLEASLEKISGRSAASVALIVGQKQDTKGRHGSKRAFSFAEPYFRQTRDLYCGLPHENDDYC
jgi:hypothetical protein